MPAPVPFNPNPLIEPVDHNAVRAWKRAQAHTASGGKNATAIVTLVVGSVVVLLVGGVFLTVLFAMASLFASTMGGPIGGGIALLAIPVLLILGGIVFALVRGTRQGATRGYRLDRFARANGMAYVPQLKSPALPGMIFGRGGARMATDVVRGERPRFVEFANYSYTTGSGKDESTHRWGYVAIKLDVPLPNIVLDAKGNNSMFGTNLPVALDKRQRLSLEGDFDQYFTLYCPQGYERDALYLFTPDIMARFIDHAAALDVEIVDDWLFLYARRDLSTLDPASWAWIFSTVRALLDKLAQWARWRDDRLQMDASAPPIPGLSAAAASEASAVPFAGNSTLTPPPGIAPGGRRLKAGVAWPAVILAGGILLVWLIAQSGMFGAFLGQFGGWE